MKSKIVLWYSEELELEHCVGFESFCAAAVIKEGLI